METTTMDLDDSSLDRGLDTNRNDTNEVEDAIDEPTINVLTFTVK